MPTHKLLILVPANEELVRALERHVSSLQKHQKNALAFSRLTRSVKNDACGDVAQ